MEDSTFKRVRSHVSRNLVAYLALFVALGGTSYAAARNSIGTREIKNNSVRGRDVRNRSLTGTDIKDRSLGRLDFKAGQLKAGPRGLRGPTGASGRSALTPLRRGERVYGEWSLQSTATEDGAFSVPIPAPTQIDSRHVVMVGKDGVAGDGCTGSKTNPASAPGYVCAYPHISSGVAIGGGYGMLNSNANPTSANDGNRFGFRLFASSGGGGAVFTNGVWVYTAP